MLKTVVIAGTAYALFTAFTFAPAKANEPTVLYDANGNAVVAHLTCATTASATVLYTSARKPVAAYLNCTDHQTKVVVVEKRTGLIEHVVTNNRAQTRRTARRVVRRHED